jgi:hypothetical protein
LRILLPVHPLCAVQYWPQANQLQREGADAMAATQADKHIQRTITTMKRRGILPATGAVVAGIAMKHAAQPIAAATTAVVMELDPAQGIPFNHPGVPLVVQATVNFNLPDTINYPCAVGVDGFLMGTMGGKVCAATAAAPLASAGRTSPLGHRARGWSARRANR